MFIFFRPPLPQFWQSVELLLNSLWIMLHWLIIHVTVILTRAEWIVFVNADFLQNYSFPSCLMHCIRQSATLHLQECLVQLIHTFIYFETGQKTISQHFLRIKQFHEQCYAAIFLQQTFKNMNKIVFLLSPSQYDYNTFNKLYPETKFFKLKYSGGFCDILTYSLWLTQMCKILRLPKMLL